jgi:hypothetical protein
VLVEVAVGATAKETTWLDAAAEEVVAVYTGLTKELKNHIFDLGERSSADLMRTIQIKIAQYIGSLYGGDILGELETKTEFVAPVPSYPPSALSGKTRYETMIRAQQNNERMSLNQRLNHIESQINAANPTNTNLVMELDGQKSDIENKIMKVDYDLASDVEVPLSEEEKGEWRQEQKACGDRATKHVQHQQKAYAIIIGQCT